MPNVLAAQYWHTARAGAKDTAVADTNADNYVPGEYPEQWLQQLKQFAAPMQAGGTAGVREYSTFSSISGHRYTRRLALAPQLTTVTAAVRARQTCLKKLLPFAARPILT